MGQFVVVGLIGALLLAFGLVQLRKVRASRSWVRGVATIVEAKVEGEFRQGMNDEPDSWTYEPRVRYQYAANNEWFLGDRIRFDRRGFGNPKRAQRELLRYPIGGQVEVFFNPRNPAECVLERAASGAKWLTALGALILVLAIAAALR